MKSSMRFWSAALVAAAVTSASPILLDRAISVTDSDLTKMRLFSQYSGAAYCNSGNAVGQAVTCAAGVCPTVTSNGAKTAKTFSGVLTDIQGLIAVDPTSKLIVVTIRGSHSIRNWISDILFLQVPCPSSLGSDCQVHTGFAAAWVEVGSSVLSGVAAAKAANPGYSIVATGHSLGGAVATLAAAYLRKAGNAVDLYTFGSPRVGNSAFADFVSAQAGSEIRVTHVDDPVPRLPPLLFGYRHTSPEYWLSTGSGTTTAYGVSDVKVCEGNANTNCNAGTTPGLDINAHLNYFVPIAGCSPSSIEFKRDASSNTELEDRLNMFAALDIQYAAALANGTAS